MEEKTVEQINAMSEEELLKYEDDLEAHDAGVEPESDPPPEPSDDKGADPPADPPEPKADEGDDPPALEAGDDPGDDPAPPEPTPTPAPEPAADDDLTKHVSPPSKWAKQRREANAAKERLEQAEAKAAKADALEQELNTVKGEMEWIKDALKSKGVDLPKDPMEAITEDQIADIREEHGDTMADTIIAMAATIKRLTPASPTPPAADPEPEEDPPAAATPPAAPPADPAPTVNPEVEAAIKGNDALSWWRQESPALWKLAIAKDDALSSDPEYLALSFADRYAKVVEEVTADVKQKKPAPDPAKDPEGDSPPASLDGSTGVVPKTTDNDALAKMEAISDPAKKIEYYESLPEKIRDTVDEALGI